MICLADRADLDHFRAVITQRMGLRFDDTKLGFLAEVLQRRLDRLGNTGDAYLSALTYEPARDEIAALARELTIGETYFFRNHEQFCALAEVVFAERVRVPTSGGVLRLLSAGCSTGEEAYSMAIVAREAGLDRSCELAMRAVDVNPAVLEKAAQARYSPWALRETPADIQRKWFRPDGRDMVLHEAVRGAVQFGLGNLAREDCDLWPPETYDAVFCRNVLMYFSPEQMRAAIARIARSLVPGGFLFLGHAETLRGVSDRFHLRHTHGTFYYELKQNAESSGSRPARGAPRRSPPLASVLSLDDDWTDTIRQATDRVAALVATPASADVAIVEQPLPWDPAQTFDLLRDERFAEALEHVRAGPGWVGKDPDLLLLEAALLMHSGQIDEAKDVSLRLLLIDGLNAGAHYVLALCHEHSGCRERASEHDRVATYLDPTFAMPRLHLGLLTARAGDRTIARQELAQALTLLKNEDACRLLLFGGGFNRPALMALCEAALHECGGWP